MFGCCVAGRLLQTNLTQVDETHAYFELPMASSINHVCVFLLGTVTFPDGYGATVHFFWPGKGFQLLGMLSNDKPSAIFRLRGTFSSASAQNSNAQNVFSQQGSGQQGSDVTAILGLAIEPLAQIQAQMPSGQVSNALSKTPSVSDAVVLSENIVKHLLNYLNGFTGGAGGDIAIPMSIIKRWYDSFLGKLKAGGVGFLERQE